MILCFSAASAQDYNVLSTEGQALWDCAAHAALVDGKEAEFRRFYQATQDNLDECRECCGELVQVQQ